MIRNQPRMVSALGVGLICAFVTALVYSPTFFTDPNQGPGVALFIWLATLLGAAPLTAFLMNRRWPTATDALRGLLTGLPQLPLLILLMQVDLWVDVRSGYLPPGTSEHAMAYGFGTILSAFGGMVLWGLVGSAARRGASRSVASEGRGPEAGATGTGSPGQGYAGGKSGGLKWVLLAVGLILVVGGGTCVALLVGVGSGDDVDVDGGVFVDCDPEAVSAFRSLPAYPRVEVDLQPSADGGCTDAVQPADPAAFIDHYEQVMRDAGWQVDRQGRGVVGTGPAGPVFLDRFQGNEDEVVVFLPPGDPYSPEGP